ncbi:MAG: acetyl-CoA carboxylase biotin carboxyl carrier protein subunit, partial [Candidatus Puniceispirillales bacterium]
MNDKKKNNLDEVNLVQALSDIVNTDKLSELEYETDVCKIKIVKHSNPIFSNVPSVENQTINTVPVEKENKTITTSEKYNNKHPGAVNSPMVGTAYSASEPGKDPFIKINSS